MLLTGRGKANVNPSVQQLIQAENLSEFDCKRGFTQSSVLLTVFGSIEREFGEDWMRTLSSTRIRDCAVSEPGCKVFDHQGILRRYLKNGSEVLKYRNERHLF